MIYWYQQLYMDETVSERPNRCKKRVEECYRDWKKTVRLWKGSYYIVALAANPENLFDIMECKQMFFRHYQSQDFYIIGLTSTREAAIDVVQTIIQEKLALDEKADLHHIFRKEDFEK